MTAGSTVLVLVPHQDDELLIMGPALLNATRAGREVYLVLFGLGDGTVVRTRDMPRLLGYVPNPEQIGRVRDHEFVAAAAGLGVPRSRVFAAPVRQPEKQFDLGVTSTAVAACLARLPQAQVWVVSEFDPNPDHAILGTAVRLLWDQGGLAVPPRAFVAPWWRGSVPHPVVEPETAEIGYAEQQPYRFTDVHAGRWGVGLKSVPRYFDAQLANPTVWSYALNTRDPAG